MDGFILIMKKTIISIAILFSVCASAQKIDSTKHNDSIAIASTINLIQQVGADMKASLYGKVNKDYYEVIEYLFTLYIKEKQLQFSNKK